LKIIYSKANRKVWPDGGQVAIFIVKYKKKQKKLTFQIDGSLAVYNNV